MLKPMNSYVMIEIIKEEPKKLSDETVVLDAEGNPIPQEPDYEEEVGEPCVRGTVVAVGPGHITENGFKKPMTVAIGDIVLGMKYAGTYLAKWQYYLLREESILAIE